MISIEDGIGDDEEEETEICDALNQDVSKLYESIQLLKRKTSDNIDELIEYLNQLPEISSKSCNLIEPVDIELLNWKKFNDELNLHMCSTRSFKRDIKKLNIQSKRQQIYFYSEVLEMNIIIQPTSIKRALAILFDTQKSNISSFINSYKCFLDYYPNSKGKGRPLLLSPKQIEQLINEISTKELEYQPMSKSDILQYISENFDLKLNKKWVNRFIKKKNELSYTDAIPLDECRSNVTKIQIQKYFIELREACTDVHPDLILNIDEIGFARKVQGKKKKCIICTKDPKMSRDRTVYYQPISDNLKTFTLIACVSCSGERLIPLIICPTQSFPECFLQKHVWQGKDCFLAYNESGFNTSKIFELWFHKVFLPHIENVRLKLYGNKYEKKWAVLICDGMTGHGNDDVKSFAAHFYVRIVFLPSHSSHILQALDKYVFAIMKSIYYNCEITQEIINRNGKKIIKILKAFYQSTTPFVIRASFKAIGIDCKWSSKGEFISIEINETDIITNHNDKIIPSSELIEKETKRKRFVLENKNEYFLINNSQIIEESLGLCALCHQLKPENDSLFDNFKNNVAEIVLISSEVMLSTVKTMLYLIESENEKNIEFKEKLFNSSLCDMIFTKFLTEDYISPEILLHPNHILLKISKEIDARLKAFKEKQQSIPLKIKIKGRSKRKSIEKKIYTVPIINRIDYTNKSLPGVRGIANINHKICALCSSLQILLHTMPLIKLLLRAKWDSFISPEKSPLTRMLTALAIQIWSPVETKEDLSPPINPTEILEYLVLYFSLGDGPYDAMELLIMIISGLFDEFAPIHPNPIGQIFYGLARDECICLKCGDSVTHNVPFNFISLPWTTSNSKYKINLLFKKWSEWQKQKAGYSRICDNCKKKVQVKTRTVIIKLPTVLMISVPRNTLEEHDKNLDAFRFLSMETIGIEGPNDIQNSKGHLLYGFINHIENRENSHFIAHINVGKRNWENDIDFNPKVDEKWFMFDDSFFKEEKFNLLNEQRACTYAYVGTNEIDFQLL